jgi:membrane-associated protease RseP (regulator of RpoE activity)
MAHSRRRIRVFRGWEECPPRSIRNSVLIEVPGKWAFCVVSLIEASQEYRHAGLMVTNIGPGSQAARAGMVRGDVLLRYEGQELDTASTLRRLTRAYTQGAAAKKALKIEGARGKDDVEFEVRGGHLGITVSPMLHRTKTFASGWKRVLRKLGVGDAAQKVTPHVVHTVEEARKHRPGDPALVIVPGDLARPVLSILRAVERTGYRKRKHRAKSLLAAASRTA